MAWVDSAKTFAGPPLAEHISQFFLTGADEISAADNASEMIPDIVLTYFHNCVCFPGCCWSRNVGLARGL